MMKLGRIILACVFSLGIWSSVTDTVSAHWRAEVRPWWPWPVVIFPVIPPPPPPAVAPPPYVVSDYGHIVLNVHPKDALVYINGEYRGLAADFDGTRAYLDLPAGRYMIGLQREGYSPVSFDITAEPGRYFTLDVNMNPAGTTAPGENIYQFETDKTGTIEFDINPPDAAIYIDGKFFGTATQFATDVSNAVLLRSGTHYIEVSRPGYVTHRETITVVNKEKIKLKIKLKKEG